MKGLTSAKAEEFLNKYGLNTLKEQEKKNILLKLFEQFNNFLTILLIAASLLSFFIGEPVDGFLILGIVVLNALFGLYQESKAEAAIQLLKKMSVTKVRVIRDGREKEIDSKFLVPGDIIFVESGSKIPADAILIDAKNLEVDESALTGESLAVIKKNNDNIFMGTNVTKGRSYAQLISTGMDTKFGKIAAKISEIEESDTPLQKKLNKLTRLIGIIGIIISIFVFLLSLASGSSYFPAFLLAISLAVAVVPEGLPAVMTITLAIGVNEMAKKKAIIRKLSAIEALGTVTLIATDKTGTLTENKMKVSELFIDEKKYETNNLPNLKNDAFSKLVMNGILCSTSSLVFVHDHNAFDVLGDPTEGALLFLAQKVGLIPEEVRAKWKILDEVPFDSITKKMSVLVSDGREKILYVKGAPEEILSECQSILIGEKSVTLTAKKRKETEEMMREWAHKGLRVLGFAYEVSPKSSLKAGALRDKQIPNLKSENLTFLGMVALHDPPRAEVREALKKAKGAGIEVVMVTGDSEITAEAIGVSIGLMKEGDEILTGSQLNEFSDDKLLKILLRVRIFARTTPFDKHRIVSLYQKMGEIVAVTGDGVNDVIALKQADVGVAMGIVGTDVTRDVADMVITDDNFASIVNAIEEGRNIVKNLTNSVKYLLSCNISEAVTLITALALGISNLLYPIQLLYINLVTDGLPALSLAFSPRHESLMNVPPEKELTLLKKFDRNYIFFVGILSTILVIVSYFIFGEFGKIAAFSVLTLNQSFILIDLWLSHRSIFRNLNQLVKPVFIFAFIFPFVSQFAIVFFPNISVLFRLEPVSHLMYLEFIAFSFMIIPGTYLIKKLQRL